ncbi:hypothetical protein DFJ73DRAFT_782015 [Zopfochytrium polystomum]|nr:hypothetical protein DFJ73DRAFT_782015 [Zopfochytrium polystomum]
MTTHPPAKMQPHRIPAILLFFLALALLMLSARALPLPANAVDAAVHALEQEIKNDLAKLEAKIQAAKAAKAAAAAGNA